MKGQREAIGISPPCQDSKPKEQDIFGGIAGITTITKYLNDAEMLILISSPFNTSIWSVQKADGS